MPNVNGEEQQPSGSENLTSPTPSLASNVIPQQLKQPWWKTKMAIGLGVLVVLVAGLIMAYQVYASPSRVWQKFMSQSLQASQMIAHEDFNMSYQDNGEIDSTKLQDNPLSGMLSKLKFSVGGSAYVNSSNPSSIESAGDFSYTFASGGTSFSAKLQAVMKGQDVYVKLGDIPVIASIFAQLDPSQKVDWVRVNFKELQDFARAQGDKSVPVADYNEQTKHYQTIIEKHWAKLVSVQKVLGKETLHNVKTIHYANNIDKTELKNLVNEVMTYSFDQAQQLDASTSPEELAKTKASVISVFNKILDRTQVKTFETWVGISDARIYKVAFSATMPSIVSMVSVSNDITKNQPDLTDPEQIIEQVIQQSSFDGQFDLTEEFYDYGKIQSVTAPSGAMDFVQKIKELEDKQKQTDPLLNSKLPKQSLSGSN